MYFDLKCDAECNCVNIDAFDLNCDAECNGVNVGCLDVSVINVPYNT